MWRNAPQATVVDRRIRSSRIGEIVRDHPACAGTAAGRDRAQGIQPVAVSGPPMNCSRLSTRSATSGWAARSHWSSGTSSTAITTALMAGCGTSWRLCRTASFSTGTWRIPSARRSSCSRAEPVRHSITSAERDGGPGARGQVPDFLSRLKGYINVLGPTGGRWRRSVLRAAAGHPAALDALAGGLSRCCAKAWRRSIPACCGPCC